MSTVTGVVRVGAVTLAAAALAVGATRVSGSVQLATPGERAGLPESSSVLVEESSLVCPGQQRLGAVGLRDVRGSVTVAAAAPAPGVVEGLASGAGTVQLLSGARSTGLAQGTTPGAAVSAAAPGADLVMARATGTLAPGLVATQVWRHTGDDDRGLAVTPCQLPSSDVWLVGGGDGPSRTERVVVTNPGANAVSVSFEMLGRSGRIAAADDRSVSIPPLSRTVVSLDAIAPSEAGPVVHVSATGGVVTAVLDEQWILGATGRGIDDSTRAAAPATDLVVPGIETGGSSVWVRLANPGDTEALAQVRLLTATGAVQPDALRAVRVPAGSTVDVAAPVNAAAMGLGVRSDQPLVAAAWTERRATTGDRMGDFAWTAATPALHGVAGVLLPGLSGTSKRVLLTAGPAGAQVQVRLGSGPGAPVTTVSVPADSTRAVDAGSADGVWVVPRSGTVRGAVSVVGADAGVPFFGVAALSDAPVRAQSVPVRQVRN